MSKPKAKQQIADPTRGPLISVRFVICLLLVAAGIAYVVFWTLYVRDLRAFDAVLDPAKAGDKPEPIIPAMTKLDNWNYIIGFGLIFLGLALSAHPSTPLGRGKGVIVGMLGCFLIGLIWICTFYVISGNNLSKVPVFNDLDQFNLLVGIGFMAVGFAFATKWE